GSSSSIRCATRPSRWAWPVTHCGATSCPSRSATACRPLSRSKPNSRRSARREKSRKRAGLSRTRSRGEYHNPRARLSGRGAMSDRTMSIDGVRVPRFLYGTAWKEDQTRRLTELALRQGFRGVDTANQRRHYHEAAVGQAVAASVAGGLLT